MSRCLRPFLSLSIGLAAVLLASPARALEQSETPVVPLVLDGATTLRLDPDPSWEFESGTLEFWVMALWDEDPGYFPCVVASRSSAEAEDPDAPAGPTRFSVHIAPGRDEIGFFNGSAWGSVPFDFSDERYHHVALVTAGGETEVIIDGDSRGKIGLGYGPGSGLPLSVGTSDGASEPFIGALWSLRLWRAPLELAAIRTLSNLEGPPGESDPSGGSLVAYSSFRQGAPELLIVSDEDSDEEVGVAGVTTRGRKKPTQASKTDDIVTHNDKRYPIYRDAKGKAWIRIRGSMEFVNGTRVAEEWRKVRLDPGKASKAETAPVFDPAGRTRSQIADQLQGIVGPGRAPDPTPPPTTRPPGGVVRVLVPDGAPNADIGAPTPPTGRQRSGRPDAPPPPNPAVLNPNLGVPQGLNPRPPRPPAAATPVPVPVAANSPGASQYVRFTLATGQAVPPATAPPARRRPLPPVPPRQDSPSDDSAN